MPMPEARHRQEPLRCCDSTLRRNKLAQTCATWAAVVPVLPGPSSRGSLMKKLMHMFHCEPSGKIPSNRFFMLLYQVCRSSVA